jgi:hypothetical protein
LHTNWYSKQAAAAIQLQNKVKIFINKKYQANIPLSCTIGRMKLKERMRKICVNLNKYLVKY